MRGDVVCYGSCDLLGGDDGFLFRSCVFLVECWLHCLVEREEGGRGMKMEGVHSLGMTMRVHRETYG